MYHEYPYSTYWHDVDNLCGACKSCGLRLVIQGDYLRLVDKDNNVISNVQVSYAEKALYDNNNHPISAYLISASEDGTHLVFGHGDGTYTTIDVPLAERAAKDLQNKDILNYAYGLSISGDKLAITRGDATVYELTIPFATAASEDDSGKKIDTYAASLETDGTELVLRDSKGRQLSRITVNYATNAGAAATADLATEATHALDADDADHADEADVATLANLATNATNAVQSVTISGNQMIFTTYGGTQTTIECPYSVKALKDNLSNEISKTYVASVTNDINTGKIQFWDAEGTLITELIPTVTSAATDSYGNLIADYVKTITADSQSDYITVTTGKGISTTVKVNYSEHAYLDTNEQVIKNTYVTELQCVEDVDDGHYKLVWYNGDIPRAEIGRCEVWAYKAQVDKNERDLTSYVGDVSVDTVDSKLIDVHDGENTVINQISGQITTTPAGSITASASGTAVTLTSGTAPSLTYDANTQYLEFAAGTFPAIDTVTDPSISATFSGTQSTESVDFSD